MTRIKQLLVIGLCPREFCVSVYLMTEAPKDVKLKKIFTIMDADESGNY